MLSSFCTKHLLQAMNDNTGIFKKGREVKIILKDRAYSSMPLKWQAARSAARNQRNHINEEPCNDFCFINS